MLCANVALPLSEGEGWKPRPLHDSVPQWHDWYCHFLLVLSVSERIDWGRSEEMRERKRKWSSYLKERTGICWRFQLHSNKRFCPDNKYIDSTICSLVLSDIYEKITEDTVLNNNSNQNNSLHLERLYPYCLWALARYLSYLSPSLGWNEWFHS